MRGTLESYDGAAVVSTVDPYEALIEIQVPPGCERLVFEVLEHLSTEEDIGSSPETFEGLDRIRQTTR